MPPKARITRDMIIDAAFGIIKVEGIGMLNARNIAKRLDCSTQPILYYFLSMEELKNVVYKKIDDYHTSFITDIQGEYSNPLLEIGIRYIRFAATERELFKFLFQSDKFSDKDLKDIISADDLFPILQIMSQATGLSMEQAKELFELVFFIVHGMASFLANNGTVYDERHVQDLLKDAFKSGMYSIKTKVEKS